MFSASVRQEISFGILNLGAGETEAAEAVDRVMEEMEITPFQDQPVHALSGGQKKQVSIADVLVMKPEIVILDEPAGGAGSEARPARKKLLAGLTGQGITVIVRPTIWIMPTAGRMRSCFWAADGRFVREVRKRCARKRSCLQRIIWSSRSFCGCPTA